MKKLLLALLVGTLLAGCGEEAQKKVVEGEEAQKKVQEGGDKEKKTLVNIIRKILFLGLALGQEFIEKSSLIKLGYLMRTFLFLQKMST